MLTTCCAADHIHKNKYSFYFDMHCYGPLQYSVFFVVLIIMNKIELSPNNREKCPENEALEIRSKLRDLSLTSYYKRIFLHMEDLRYDKASMMCLRSMAKASTCNRGDDQIVKLVLDTNPVMQLMVLLEEYYMDVQPSYTRPAAYDSDDDGDFQSVFGIHIPHTTTKFVLEETHMKPFSAVLSFFRFLSKYEQIDNIILITRE